MLINYLLKVCKNLKRGVLIGGGGGVNNYIIIIDVLIY